MGIFKRMFAGPEDVAGIVETGAGVLDKFTFTNEERSEASFKAFELWIKAQEATSGQNLARRYIALIVVGLWAFLIALAAVVGLVEVFVLKSPPDASSAAGFVFRVMSDAVLPLAIVVVAFYFSKGMVDQGLKVWADSKSARKAAKARGE